MTDEHVIKIIEKIGEVSERVGRIEEITTNTLAQTVKTNGRVTTLENKVDSLELTRAENKGSWKVAATIATFASGIVTLILNKIIKI